MTDAAAPTVDEQRFADFVTVVRRESKARLCVPGFSTELPLESLSAANILLVGAGGIGCELLHSLAISPLMHCNFWLIDMDTIDLSNLNRQFLFREEHIGKPKSSVAAEEIKKRYPAFNVTPIFGRVEEQGADFYRSMHMILLGLDSVHARQWMNQTVCTLYHEAKALSPETARPIMMIDGGTEGYKGSVRRIEMGDTPCIECLMYQFPPTRGVPMCTLENIPRNASHCVLYVMEKTFKDELPFGPNAQKPDGDDEAHILWIQERAVARQAQFKIEGDINFQFTQGVVKNIVPAVGFANALVAATMVNETIKVFTAFGRRSQSQVQYDGASKDMGIGSTTPPCFADPSCVECGARAVATVTLDTPIADIAPAAWRAVTKGTPQQGTPLPGTLKAVMAVNMQRSVIHSKGATGLATVDGGKRTIKDAGITAKVKDGGADLVVPMVAGETVLTVELTLIKPTAEEKKAAAATSQDAAATATAADSEDEVFDIAGFQERKVMVVIN